MEDRPGTIARPRELAVVSLAGLALAILMTWPLATGLGHLGRTAANDADGQISIWNVSWVARTLVVDPLHVFDANVFHPRKTTLAYSEANLLPGAIGIPVYWASGNPWLTLNFVLLVAFTSAFVCMYLLLLYLTGDRVASVTGAVVYTFCPYVMSHLSHIQLLFTGGIPLSLLMLHRLADAVTFRLKAETTESYRVTESTETDRAAATTESNTVADTTETNGGAESKGANREAESSSSTLVASAFRRNTRWRGVALGLALAAQALSCAYYGIFAGLAVGFAALVLAATRNLWKSAAYWTAIATGAGVSFALALPFFVPYLRVQQETGFARTIEDAIRYAAGARDYLMSATHAHQWLQDWMRSYGPWSGEVLFPGFSVLGLGAAGLVIALRRRNARERETALLYGSLAVLAFWSSFGPAAGLYRVLSYLPAFSFLRAPSRLGLIVVLCLAVLAAITLRAIFGALSRGNRRIAAGIAVAAAIGELAVFPLRWFEAPQVPVAYAALAGSPRAPMAEFPFYGERVAFPLHTQYMLFSTRHWLPIVNGYSDVIPLDFREAAPVLDGFPSGDAFLVLARRRVRYIAVHWDMYVNRQEEIRRRLVPYAANLRVLSEDSRMTLYEVVKYP